MTEIPQSPDTGPVRSDGNGRRERQTGHQTKNVANPNGKATLQIVSDYQSGDF